jgi:putative transposase
MVRAWLNKEQKAIMTTQTRAKAGKDGTPAIDLHRFLNDRLTATSPELMVPLLEVFITEIMGTEADGACEAQFGAHADGRANNRNGYRRRSLRTSYGNVALKIPKLRRGSYYPTWLLQQRDNAEERLTAAVSASYLLGVTPARLEGLLADLGVAPFTQEQLTSVAARLDEEVSTARNRPLSRGPYTFVATDALVLQVCEQGAVKEVHTLVALGANGSGVWEILGIDTADQPHDGDSWARFFRSLIARGLSGAKLVTSTARSGLIGLGEANPAQAGALDGRIGGTGAFAPPQLPPHPAISWG